MRQRLLLLLIDDENPEAVVRTSVVAPQYYPPLGESALNLALMCRLD